MAVTVELELEECAALLKLIAGGTLEDGEPERAASAQAKIEQASGINIADVTPAPFDFAALPSQQGAAPIDFSDVAQPDGSFDFAIFAALPDKPALLTVRVDGSTLRAGTRAHFAEVFRLLLADAGTLADVSDALGTVGLEDTLEALIAGPEIQGLISSARRLVAYHLRDVVIDACNIVMAYSTVWALIPYLDNTTRGDFRASMVRGVLETSFRELDTLVEKVRVAVRRILRARDGGRVQDMAPAELKLAVKQAAWAIMRENPLDGGLPVLKQVADRLGTSSGALSKRLRHASRKLPGCNWAAIKRELLGEVEKDKSIFIS